MHRKLKLPLQDSSKSWACWHTPVTSALRRLRKEDREFKTCLDYKVKPCLKTQRERERERETCSEISKPLPGRSHGQAHGGTRQMQLAGCQTPTAWPVHCLASFVVPQQAHTGGLLQISLHHTLTHSLCNTNPTPT
jgi:hypothetical protein